MKTGSVNVIGTCHLFIQADRLLRMVFDVTIYHTFSSLESNLESNKSTKRLLTAFKTYHRRIN